MIEDNLYFCFLKRKEYEVNWQMEHFLSILGGVPLPSPNKGCHYFKVIYALMCPRESSLVKLVSLILVTGRRPANWWRGDRPRGAQAGVRPGWGPELTGWSIKY